MSMRLECQRRSHKYNIKYINSGYFKQCILTFDNFDK